MSEKKLYEYIAPCHFGLEAVLKREIQKLGYNITKVDNGKVTFEGDINALARANIFLRTTERILLKVAEFKAVDFDELFEGTYNIPWENFIPKDGKFWVKKVNSIKSKNHSPRDIQAIMKKAMVKRLEHAYKISVFPETGAEYPLRVTIMNDVVTVGLDTSGASLHMRGYRKATVPAPITETLAAALIMLTPWNKDRILVDPFCGSGTFPIEAALIGMNQAPGLNREFTAEEWDNIVPKNAWYEAVNEANDLIIRNPKMDIQGYDIDERAIEASIKNATDADVRDLIHFQVRDITKLSHRKKYGFVITNPPYGERLDEKKNMYELYKKMGEAFRNLDSWSYYVITAFEDIEKCIGKRADKNRKIYNGMMKTYLYQYMGPRPPKPKKETD
ncbi:MAG: class I SAM-dependent RNA methyltransferase [Lachnospiraceae bacterium]|nr:class I SAM-dependent RNA methyltransferase [Lachnospiraceae bacterium]